MQCLGSGCDKLPIYKNYQLLYPLKNHHDTYVVFYGIMILFSTVLDEILMFPVTEYLTFR